MGRIRIILHITQGWLLCLVAVRMAILWDPLVSYWTYEYL